MEKEGTKIVPIIHSDDKRQLTAVLAITSAGEYLPPQLLYKGGRQNAIHRFHFQLARMCDTQKTIGQMKSL